MTVKKSKNDEPTFHRVAIYIRVSTGAQVRDGYSLDDQEALCIQYAEEKFGTGNLTYKVFREEGRSGQKLPHQMGGKGSKERRVVSELIDAIEDGQFTDVLCNEVTRSTRDQYFWQRFKIDHCRPNDATLRFRMGDLNCDDEDDEFSADMQALMGQREAKMTGRRIRDGRQLAFEQGYWPHGQNPWGWEREPRKGLPRGQRRKLVPIPDRTQWLVRMKDRLIKDAWGLERIAKELQANGVPSGKTYAVWSATEVHRKLTHPVHAGFIEDAQGNLIPGVHAEHALWDLDTYHQILAVLESRRPDMSNRHRAADFPLAGILRCGHCGHVLNSYRSKDPVRRHYRCRGGLNGGDECPGVMKEAKAIEDCVVAAIRDLANGPTMTRYIEEEAEDLLTRQREELTNDAARLRRKLSELEGKLIKMADAFTNGTIDPRQFQTISDKWRAEEEQARQELARVEGRLERGEVNRRLLQAVRDAIGRIDETWDQLDGAQKRDLLRGLLERLELTRTDGELVLTIKPYVLPAIQHRLNDGRNGTLTIDGVGDFTPRQLALLAHVLDGKDYQEIARIWNVNAQNVYGIARAIRTKSGIGDIQEIARRAKDVIDDSRAWLPLEGRMQSQDLPKQVRLSPRQREVLDGYAADKDRKQIAAELGLHPTSVSVRMTEIKHKLDTMGIKDSITRAQQLGLLSPIA